MTRRRPRLLPVLNNGGGLPELPEGYFWRVRPLYLHSGFSRIELRKKVWLYSIPLACGDIPDTLINEQLVFIAEKVLLQHNRNLSAFFASDHYGDYPPKNSKGRRTK